MQCSQTRHLLLQRAHPAGAQIRAETAEEKLQKASSQLQAAKKHAAELKDRLVESDSEQDQAAAAQQDLTKAQHQLRLLQQSHQDLSDRFKESCSKCTHLQVQS